MKLIIDIDDSLYDAIQTKFYVNGMRSGKTLLQKLIVIIRKGIPLKDEVMFATLLSLVADKNYKPKLEGEQE